MSNLRKAVRPHHARVLEVWYLIRSVLKGRTVDEGSKQSVST